MLEAILLTGRDWRQGTAMEGPGKTSREYQEIISRCDINQADMDRIRVKPGDPVRVGLGNKSVIVLAHHSEYEDVEEGQVFIPMGIYANVLLDGDTTGTGMPNFKGLKVRIEPAPGEKVKDIRSLIKEHVLKE
jgi:formylmethanofuran dehydrogenase subunit D